MCREKNSVAVVQEGDCTGNLPPPENIPKKITSRVYIHFLSSVEILYPIQAITSIYLSSMKMNGEGLFSIFEEKLLTDAAMLP